MEWLCSFIMHTDSACDHYVVMAVVTVVLYMWRCCAGCEECVLLGACIYLCVLSSWDAGWLAVMVVGVCGSSFCIVSGGVFPVHVCGFVLHLKLFSWLFGKEGCQVCDLF